MYMLLPGNSKPLIPSNFARIYINEKNMNL